MDPSPNVKHKSFGRTVSLFPSRWWMATKVRWVHFYMYLYSLSENKEKKENRDGKKRWKKRKKKTREIKKGGIEGPNIHTTINTSQMVKWSNLGVDRTPIRSNTNARPLANETLDTLLCGETSNSGQSNEEKQDSRLQKKCLQQSTSTERHKTRSGSKKGLNRPQYNSPCCPGESEPDDFIWIKSGPNGSPSSKNSLELKWNAGG